LGLAALAAAGALACGCGEPVEATASAIGSSYTARHTYASTITGSPARGTFQAETAQMICDNGWRSDVSGAGAWLVVTPTANPDVVYFERTPNPGTDPLGRADYQISCWGWAQRVNTRFTAGAPTWWQLPYAGGSLIQTDAGLQPGNGADTWVTLERSPDGTALSLCTDQWAYYTFGSGQANNYQWWDTTIGTPAAWPSGKQFPDTVQVVEVATLHENENAGAVPCTARLSGSLVTVPSRGIPGQ